MLDLFAFLASFNNSNNKAGHLENKCFLVKQSSNLKIFLTIL